ncbi:orange carotenoid protein N-terminal domain-containing protein [Oscillatoria sp. CS-180]|uniref:orange carotenoid protein N-terminal domain-containing protein n=1 Tax=Oscillatoria sp. CS-180 TaxID=3021720 RepID=UPI00233016E1|nr:orange carotenoid protein N-terminal domain-containing protein [Oscillatoria sp. CS-180]MDB9525709.1 orange carotenoid protein N-terminal domain-containing protein [Oscillatoria sp. CS-180]
MTTNNTAVDDTNKAIESFRGLGVDEQLAWLWYVYKKMGDSVTPAAPGAASESIAEGLFNQVKQQSKEEQLESMRAIARSDADNQISREYGSLSANTKLAFWYALAIGMDEGSIIGMPEDYSASDGSKNLLSTIEQMDLEEQITLLRNAVEPMGADPKVGATA